MSFWNSRKYLNPDIGGTDPTDISEGQDRTMVRATDALAQHGFVIGFEHVPTSNRVQFKAFITAFNETYKSNWNTETVFGRGDPIHMFKNTERTISLSWKIPADSVSEGYENLYRLQQFIQFLYPTYTDIQGAQTINQSPLVRLELMNLVRDRQSIMGESWNEYRTPDDLRPSQQQITETAPDWSANQVPNIKGLLGVIGSVSIAHNLDTDVGVFERGITATNDNTGTSARILPKMIEVQIDFSAIHEHPLGWQNNYFGGSNPLTRRGRFFPYGVNGEGAHQEADSDFLGGGAAAFHDYENPPNTDSNEDIIDSDPQLNTDQEELAEERAEVVGAGTGAEMQAIAGIAKTSTVTMNNGVLTTTTTTTNPDGSVMTESTLSLNVTEDDKALADALEAEGREWWKTRRKR